MLITVKEEDEVIVVKRTKKYNPLESISKNHPILSKFSKTFNYEVLQRKFTIVEKDEHLYK